MRTNGYFWELLGPDLQRIVSATYELLTISGTYDKLTTTGIRGNALSHPKNWVNFSLKRYIWQQ